MNNFDRPVSKNLIPHLSLNLFFLYSGYVIPKITIPQGIFYHIWDNKLSQFKH